MFSKPDISTKYTNTNRYPLKPPTIPYDIEKDKKFLKMLETLARGCSRSRKINNDDVLVAVRSGYRQALSYLIKFLTDDDEASPEKKSQFATNLFYEALAARQEDCIDILIRFGLFTFDNICESLTKQCHANFSKDKRLWRGDEEPMEQFNFAIRFLLNRNVKVGCENRYFTIEEEKVDLLMCAAKCGSTDAVNCLLECGANFSWTRQENPTLIFAIPKQPESEKILAAKIECMHLLLQNYLSFSRVWVLGDMPGRVVAQIKAQLRDTDRVKGAAADEAKLEAALKHMLNDAEVTQSAKTFKDDFLNSWEGNFSAADIKTDGAASAGAAAATPANAAGSGAEAKATPAYQTIIVRLIRLITDYQEINFQYGNDPNRDDPSTRKAIEFCLSNLHEINLNPENQNIKILTLLVEVQNRIKDIRFVSKLRATLCWAESQVRELMLTQCKKKADAPIAAAAAQSGGGGAEPVATRALITRRA